MLLSKLLLIVVLAAIEDIRIIAVVFSILILYNIAIKTDFSKKIWKLKGITGFIIFTIIFQVLFFRNGKVLLSINPIIITDKGIITAVLTILKIFCIILLSWTINYDKIRVNKKLERYTMIIKTSVKIIPEVLPLIKKKFSFKVILFKVYRAVLKEIRANEKI